MLKNKLSIKVYVEEQKHIQFTVPSVLVKNWKTMLGLTSSIFFVLCCLTFFFVTKKEKEITAQYVNILQRANQKQNHHSAAQTKRIHSVKESLSRIDSAITVINNKMTERGLHSLATANTGGPLDKDENITNIGSYYEETLLELAQKLEDLPLGAPHHGEVTSGFGYRKNPFTNEGLEMHSGIDLRGNTGDTITATAQGTVYFAENEAEYGYVVKVMHSHGYETRYAHLSKILVKKGEKLEAGAVVGLLGNTGRSTGPHVHYEILKNNRKINPEQYLNF